MLATRIPYLHSHCGDNKIVRRHWLDTLAMLAVAIGLAVVNVLIREVNKAIVEVTRVLYKVLETSRTGMKEVTSL